MSSAPIDVAIIGAGPYGLSLAAHLRDSGKEFRIFGPPMKFWSAHMPRGMCLKSEGFATGLYDPDGQLTLKSYCALHRIPYADIGLPVPVEVFIRYALEFQRRYVPQLETTEIASLGRSGELYELETTQGERVRARRVIVATGIVNFGYVPEILRKLDSTQVTHSSAHSDMTAFKGRRVGVMGGGSSAVDLAALLHQAGAHVELLARRGRLAFHERPKEPRPWLERIKAPRSGLGTGWRSRLCTDVPLLFHAMPKALRVRAVARHLGPAPCWFTRELVVGRFPVHLGTTLQGARTQGSDVVLEVKTAEGKPIEMKFDHVIAATGYQVAVSKLNFIQESIQDRLRKLHDTPVLDRHFQASLPGLYFTGTAAANSFGPLLRFAYGAQLASRRISSHLARA